jgi:hypothetical protein
VAWPAVSPSEALFGLHDVRQDIIDARRRKTGRRITGQPELSAFPEKSRPLPAAGERQNSLSVLARRISGRPWRT